MLLQKTVAIVAFAACSLSVAAQTGNPIRLENAAYVVDVAPTNGAIRRFYDKRSRTELISEARLADNFRLLVPLARLEGNYILGTEQKLASHQQQGDTLTLSWQTPLTNSQGKYDIDVRMTIALSEAAAEVKLSLRNRSDHSIDEVWYPVLGGITGVGSREDTDETINLGGWTSNTHLFRHFPSMGGGALGIPFAETYWSYPQGISMPWFDLSNAKLGRGVYVGVHDPVSRYKALRFELHPGLANREGDNWPTKEEMRPDEPLGLISHWTLFPYIKPGSDFDGPPIHIQFHDGDWHAAARVYRDWFRGNFHLADRSRNWMYREPGFLDTMFLLPEGNVKFKFADIP